MRQNYTHRLPEVRITAQLYRKMHNAAKENESKLTDLIRAALEQFFSDDIDTPAGDTESFAVPVAGVLTNTGITFRMEPKVRARYMEFEQVGQNG